MFYLCLKKLQRLALDVTKLKKRKKEKVVLNSKQTYK